MRFTGLWRHPDFVRLWAGQTISVFGSLITGTALPFTAILALDASAFEVGLLAASRTVPGLLIGPFAGVWADRLSRRPLMIAADLARALLLATIPLAYAFDALRIEQLYAVAFTTGALTMIFDVAYQSYLPSLVTREELIEGNSKLQATSSVAEFGAFSLGGWLVQILSGPLAILIDSVTFVFSALFVRAIRAPEPAVAVTPAEQRPGVRREFVEGLRAVFADPLLRAMAGALALQSLSFGIVGALVLLYLTRELGFEPGVLGVIFGVGGVTSLAGALAAGRITGRLGVGPSMVLGLLLYGLTMLLLPAARGATVFAAALLIGNQLADGTLTVYDINQTSLRQTIAGERVLGRVNAFMRILEVGFTLAGTLVAGVLGGPVGLRPMLVAGAAGTIAAALLLALSPVRAVRAHPASSAEGVAAEP